jgi:hypothetical protein
VVTASTEQARKDLNARVSAFVGRLDLQDVRFTRLTGELFDESTDEITGIDAPTVQVQLRTAEQNLDCRWVVAFPIKGADGDLARIETTVVQSFLHEDGQLELPDDELMQHFLQYTAYFGVFPYLREALQTMSVRLGLSPVIMGFLHRGDLAPRAIYVRDTDKTSGSDANPS